MHKTKTKRKSFRPGEFYETFEEGMTPLYSKPIETEEEGYEGSITLLPKSGKDITKKQNKTKH